VRRFPWSRPLTGAYAFNFSSIAPFYAGDPRSPEAWREALERVHSHKRPRNEIADCLAVQQARREAPPASREAAAKLRNPDAVAVVTGQQAGAFGGPLFTLLKALTAIQLARRTEATLGVPALAVFWVDAEDHDWEEVAGCTVLDAQYEPRTITLPPPAGAGEHPVATVTLDERVLDSIEILRATLAETDFTTWLIDGLRGAYRPGAGMADAFGRWLESLLGRYGLVVFDSSDPAAKPLQRDVFIREAGSPGHTARLAARAGEALAARGHSPQVVPQPDSVSLFHLDGGRTPIRRQGDQFVAGARIYTAAELEREAAANPQLFSPNVLLRPIVQDVLLPTICYVAGPSELAYLGQLREVYDHFGVPMPLIHPRATATLVDSATHRFLTKYDVPLEALQPQDESALNRLLEAQLPPTVEHALNEAGEAVRRAMERVVDVIPAVDPTLAGAARTTLGKLEHEVRALHGKVIQAAKKRDETLRRQFKRAQAQSFPHGDPQERALGIVFFLNLYGPALIDRLLEDLPTDPGEHWVLTP
jgi:bacillithiol biosynthesis cysteine-adding enzyme BshC